MASASCGSHTTDPPLLRNNSTVEAFQTSRFTYPAIRVFYKRHEQEDQLPTDPAPLPLLVFVHGLGGSISQFHPLITHLSNCASCLAVDLPGCGLSSFSPTEWAAYSLEALAELLEIAVLRYRKPKQGIVLIGHSMGCGLSALLAYRQLSHRVDTARFPVSGLVAICPTTGIRDGAKIFIFKALLWIPTFFFDIWRAWDSRGGPDSPSVHRFVGSEADIETKLLQVHFNRQSKTPIWRRMAWGSLPTISSGRLVGGLPADEIWAALSIPVCLIAGEADNITPPTEARKIASFLDSTNTEISAPANDHSTTGGNEPVTRPPSPTLPDPISHVDGVPTQGINPSFQPPSPIVSYCRSFTSAGSDDVPPGPVLDDDVSNISDSVPAVADIPPLPRNPPKITKCHVIPPPATHALLYSSSVVGVISGLISIFLSRHITGRLDRGWQLRFLSREGKWDVKNLEKWSKVQPVSSPIAGIFRAMKTLRQVDDVHSPELFVRNWAHIVKDVIDISHDNPVYDPRDLDAGGIHYHKFPTVSKIPPTPDEVEAFNALVDRIRAKHTASQVSGMEPAIGVHCHYGFNRTGYFIVCYLVDRCGFTVEDAITTFAKVRPNGIRHTHFLDALSLKYAKITSGLN